MLTWRKNLIVSMNRSRSQLLNKLNLNFIHLIHPPTKTDYPGNIKMTKAKNAKWRCTLIKHAFATVLPWIREQEKTVWKKKGNTTKRCWWSRVYNHLSRHNKWSYEYKLRRSFAYHIQLSNGVKVSLAESSSSRIISSEALLLNVNKTITQNGML